MDLKKSYKVRIDREARFNESNITKSWISSLQNNHLIFAIYSLFEENHIQKVKHHFNLCGMIDAYRIKTYQDRMFDYAIPQVCYALLSDNLPFLKNIYANPGWRSFATSATKQT